MVVPTKIPPVLFRSSGYGEAYYKLLAMGKKDINEFALMCEGTDLFKEAKAKGSNQSALTATQARDQLRANVRKLLLLELS
jgi:hypothetical protein